MPNDKKLLNGETSSLATKIVEPKKFLFVSLESLSHLQPVIENKKPESIKQKIGRIWSRKY